MQTFRTITAVLLTAFVTMQGQPTAPAIATLPCSQGLYDRHLEKTPAEVWNSDDSLLVKARAAGDSKSFYYTSDTVWLNQKTFPSLHKTPRDPLTKTQDVTIDARRIEIQDRIVFDTANVTLLAEEVIFGPSGAIILTHPPRDGGDGITIVAATIDFTRALERPLQFITSDSAWPPSATRSVKMFSPNLRLKNGAKPTLANLHKLTFDDPYAPIPPGTDGHPRYVVAANSAEARKAYFNEINTKMRWPDMTVAKVARQFSLAPFQPENQKFLLDQITQHRNRIQGTQQTNARAILDQVSTLISLQSDVLGFGPFSVPRRTFGSLLDDFDNDRKEQLKTLALWNAQIVAIHRDETVSTEALDALGKNIETNAALQSTRRNEISQLMTDLNVQEQRVAALEPLIKQRQAADQEQYESDKAHDEDAANVRLAAKGVSLAASFLPVAAPVAIGIGVVVGEGGEIVARKQTGDTVSAPQAILSLPDALKQAAEFRARANETTEQWNKLRKAEDDLNTAKTEAGKKAAFDARNEALKGFGEKAGKMFEGISLPSPPQLNESDYEKKDEELQSIISQTGELRNKESATLTAIGAKSEELLKETAERAQLDAARTDLLKANLKNDPDQRRLEVLAWTIRQKIISDLAYDAALISRAYRYHTLREIDSPITEKYFWTVYTPGSPVFSQSAPNRPSDYFVTGGTADELRQELDAEQSKLEAELAAFRQGVKSDYDKYKLGNVAWQETEVEYTFDCTVDDAKCEFLNHINAEIARQVQLVREQKEVSREAIFIPARVKGTGSDRPNLLVDASVEAEFEDSSLMKDKSLLFSVVHPLFGELRSSQACYRVDFKRLDGSSNRQELTSSCLGETGCKRDQTLTRRDYIDENNQLVFLPFETAYQFLVNVVDARSAGSPQVKSLKLKFRLLY